MGRNSHNMWENELLGGMSAFSKCFSTWFFVILSSCWFQDILERRKYEIRIYIKRHLSMILPNIYMFFFREINTQSSQVGWLCDVLIKPKYKLLYNYHLFYIYMCCHPHAVDFHPLWQLTQTWMKICYLPVLSCSKSLLGAVFSGPRSIQSNPPDN